MVVLRLLHIFAGVGWVGFGFFTILVLLPADRKSGREGYRFLLNLYKFTPHNILFPAFSVTTVVAGILLYLRITDNFQADIFLRSSSGIALSVGALFGILAFGHGGAVMGRLTTQYMDAMEAALASDSAEKISLVDQLREKTFRHSLISLGLVVISLAAMASWRYI